VPLPRQKTKWLANFVVLLLLALWGGLIFRVGWVLHAIAAPDLAVTIVAIIWVIGLLYLSLWVVSVWWPNRGAKFAAWVLRSPWSFTF
jgi:hypothetical protein